VTDARDPDDLSDLSRPGAGASEQWWWDLRHQRVVRDDERGPAHDVLGPYPSRAAAEQWRDSHEAREDAWEEEDERWEGEDRPASAEEE
jgi:hypothetical protein